MPHEVFLSYSTKDTAATEAVCLFLETKGVRCWMAPRDIPVGHDWAEAIIGALNRCPVMVLIYSSHANASMQVTREVQRAFEKGLAVFPFRIEAVQPNPGLEYYLGSVHWLDALTPPLEAHMGKLAGEVQKALKRHAEGGAAVPSFPIAGSARPTLPHTAATKAKKSFPVALAVAGCLALGGAAWWFTSHETQPPQPPTPLPLTPAGTAASETAVPVAPGEALPQQEQEVPSTGEATTAALQPPALPTLSPAEGHEEASTEAAAQPPVEPPLPAAATPSQASRELPWRDSLGVAYIPVPATEVLFALWPTRVRDYEAFVKATDREWKEAGFEQEPTHPAVNITWNDAQAFCDWLTTHEREADRLPPGYHYRLPTVTEWDHAIAPDETAQSNATQELYPWGTGWPPPENAGNYDDSLGIDPFPHTSPVGSFAPNRFGLFDMSGNVWQWCAEEPGPEHRTARGGSWKSSTARELAIGHLSQITPVYLNSGYGFRCVLAPAP